MRILEVRLNGFGKFESLLLNFPGNFKVIVGRNEAGKTTVVDAISGILFGFRRGQKNLRERYQPWNNPERYTASMTLLREDGTRYLVGRDFCHDRLELFRRRGVKLESLPESELDRILQEELGLNTPQLFESTLLIRQPEVSMVAKDRMAISRIAEALGRKISGSDDNATAAQALESIRLKMEQINAASGPGSMAELAATVAERERDLAQIEQGYRRYAALVEERDRLRSSLVLVETDLQDLAGRIESGKTAMIRAEARIRLTAELAEVERILGAWNEQQAELAKVQREKEVLCAVKIDETTLSRAEDLANQLATLEVERRYEEEAVKQYQAETDLLEQEIAATKAKMASLDGQALNLEVQDRLALLIPQVNENTTRLSELFPEIDRLADKLRRAKVMLLTGIILSLIASAGVYPAYLYLTRLESFGAAGVAGLFWIWTLINLARAGGFRKSIRRLNDEIERRDSDLKERRRQVELLLQGKTAAEFQAELETSRLYRNDLWHLENALAQKRERALPEKNQAPAESLEKLAAELSSLLAEAGCRDLEELRARAGRLSELSAAEQARHETMSAMIGGLNAEELSARRDLLRNELGGAGEQPTEELGDPELAALTEERAKLASQSNAVRMRLAEIGAEIRNYQEFVLVRDRFEVEENLAEAKTRLTRAELSRNGLALAARHLEEAIFEARANLGPDLQEQTGKILGDLTGQRYHEVQIELAPTLLEVRLRAPENGNLIDPGVLSTGTIDQLYLALRLALAHQLTHTENFPLLLDDPFVNYDRERLGETIKILTQLSREHQVIWFTKDFGLAQLIREEAGLEPSVEELPGGLEEETAAGKETAAEHPA